MPKNVVQYNMLISCPGDVQDEVSIIERVVEEFNERFTDELGISIQTKHWKKSSYPQSGGKPQDLLNEQFVKDCDLAVGVLWTRFGTPTDQYGSGTEEEINIMLDAQKQVFMYFSEKALQPSKLNAKEYERVQVFKDKYKERGIYYTYGSNDEFEKKILAHLTQYFLSLQKLDELNSNRSSKLILKGISTEGALVDNYSIEEFKFDGVPTVETFLKDIKELYRRVMDIPLYEAHRTNQNSLLLWKKVNITEDEKNILRQVAAQMSIDITEDFFDLGDLTEEPTSYAILGGRKLKGTPEEKKKHQLIEEILEKINDVMLWMPIEKAFMGFKCIRLALLNDGKDIDEDIEILLSFPADAIYQIGELPKLEYSSMQYLVSEMDIQKLFGISGNKAYKEYSESVKWKSPVVDTHFNPGLLGSGRDYEEEYYNDLESIFEYSFYKEGDHISVKLSVDYIKHHTAVAFPAVIFVKQDISSIPYTISSKKLPDIQEAVISAN